MKLKAVKELKLKIKREKIKLGKNYIKYTNTLENLEELIELTQGPTLIEIEEEEFNNKIESIEKEIELIKDNDYLSKFRKIVKIISKRLDIKPLLPIYDKLKELRIEKGLNMSELSRLSGISTGYIGRYENGDRYNLSLAKLNKIAEALNVSMLSLILEVSESIDDIPLIKKLKNDIKTLEEEVTNLKREKRERELPEVIQFIEKNYGVA